MSDIDFDFIEDLSDQAPMQPLRIEVGNAPNEVAEALVASMTALVERIEQAEERQERFVDLIERLAETVEGDRSALTAAIAEMKEALAREPVVNVTVPDFPEIPAPQVTVQPPEVNVTVEAPPATQKKIVVERDPLTGLIASADVTET